MRKKILLSFALAIVFALTLALVVFADSVHNENTVDYNEKVTLSDGTVLPIFDENKEALIWYISGKDEEGKNIYTSIRSDDPQVIYHCETWFEITSTRIDLADGTKIPSSDFVVVNWMDDDVVVNECAKADYIGKAVTGFKLMFQGHKKLEYIYLRHDTTSIMRQNFNGCSNLRYVNFKDLANVTRIGDSQNFSNCVELFKGQVLDLTGLVNLKRIDGGGSFNGLKVIGVKLPSSITQIGSWTFQSTAIESFVWPMTVTTMEGSMFKNNTALKEIYISNTLTKIDGDAFLNVNTLEKIFFVGTKDELNTLITNTNATGNSTFLAVAANIISYEEYLALEDKSGKYAVYDFSYCVAYNEGVHTRPEGPQSPCAWLCDVCGNATINHVEGNLNVTASYVTYDKAGVKETKCLNEGCNHIVKETLAPLFESKGFSTTIYGKGGIAICFAVNNEAISVYEGLIDSKINFGVFAGLYDTVYAKEIINAEDGTAVAGAIRSDMTSKGYDLMELKISGFMNDAQKAKQIVIGAYVIVGKDVSYLQNSPAGEGNKYSSVSFDSLASQI